MYLCRTVKEGIRILDIAVPWQPLQAVMGMLGTDPSKSSERVTDALKHWVMSPAAKTIFFLINGKGNVCSFWRVLLSQVDLSLWDMNTKLFGINTWSQQLYPAVTIWSRRRAMPSCLSTCAFALKQKSCLVSKKGWKRERSQPLTSWGRYWKHTKERKQPSLIFRTQMLGGVIPWASWQMDAAVATHGSCTWSYWR